MKPNWPQRVVLVIGALALLLTLADTESHSYYASNHWEHIWDWKAAAVRCAVVGAAVTAIFFAVGKRNRVPPS